MYTFIRRKGFLIYFSLQTTRFSIGIGLIFNMKKQYFKVLETFSMNYNRLFFDASDFRVTCDNRTFRDSIYSRAILLDSYNAYYLVERYLCSFLFLSLFDFSSQCELRARDLY